MKLTVSSDFLRDLLSPWLWIQGCDRAEDSQHENAHEKSADTTWWKHVNIDQNLRGVRFIYIKVFLLLLLLLFVQMYNDIVGLNTLSHYFCVLRKFLAFIREWWNWLYNFSDAVRWAFSNLIRIHRKLCEVILMYLKANCEFGEPF